MKKPPVEQRMFLYCSEANVFGGCCWRNLQGQGFSSFDRTLLLHHSHLCLPKRDNISRFIYLHQDIFICIKFHISVLRFVYIYQEVNLSETRFRYTYQDLHTHIKIRKYLLSYAYVHQDLHTSRFLHIYIKIHIYIEIMTGFHEVLSQTVCLVTWLQEICKMAQMIPNLEQFFEAFLRTLHEAIEGLNGHYEPN